MGVHVSAAQDTEAAAAAAAFQQAMLLVIDAGSLCAVCVYNLGI
jgi:hypothetical protein